MIDSLASPDTQPLGVGVYSLSDAARFIGASTSHLKRWMVGYEFRSRDGGLNHSPPLWTPDLAAYGYEEGLSFRDLLELRVVRAFRDRGVSLQAIRAALAFAREELTTERPFQCKRFQTDGYRIFATIRDQTGDESLVDVMKRQHTFKEIIGPSLFGGVEFDQRQNAVRWFPMRGKTVVLDPKRNFGHPIVSSGGVPTAAIAESLAAEGGNVALVARIYEISAREVKQAASYEASLTRH
jgi:uncharacterized protein (DUF433 family)